MPDFQLILRDWVKTSGFLTHELVKRFFLFYPLLCVAADCYLQVQVAFQAWFETIENAAAAPETTESTPNIPIEVSSSSPEVHATRIPNRDNGRPPVPVEPGTNREQEVDAGEAVRNFLADDLRSEASRSNAEESWG